MKSKLTSAVILTLGFFLLSALPAAKSHAQDFQGAEIISFDCDGFQIGIRLAPGTSVPVDIDFQFQLERTNPPGPAESISGSLTQTQNPQVTSFSWGDFPGISYVLPDGTLAAGDYDIPATPGSGDAGTVNLTGSATTFPLHFSEAPITCAGAPCVDIEKLVSVDGGQTFVDADDCADAPGTDSDAEYQLVVTNCGAVDLTDVTVTDPVLGIAVNIGTLAPGEVQTFTKDDPGFENLDTPGICPNGPEITNLATVTTNEGPTDSDPACVKCECVDIEKLVSVDGGQTFVDADDCADAPGTDSDAEYQLVVTNCGAVDLTDVTVTDPVLGIAVNIGTLAPGEVKTFTKDDFGFENLYTPGICPNGPEITNLATVTTNEGPTDSDPACVKCEGGGEGCTPGYWKQSQHFDNWTAPLTPTTLFSDVFEDAFPGKTLLDVLKKGGGGLKALGRHTVAALLNAASSRVSYDLTVNDVIEGFNDVFPGGDYEKLKDIFEGFNEQFCPLD